MNNIWQAAYEYYDPATGIMLLVRQLKDGDWIWQAYLRGDDGGSEMIEDEATESYPTVMSAQEEALAWYAMYKEVDQS